jgi:hypothetical protein
MPSGVAEILKPLFYLTPLKRLVSLHLLSIGNQKVYVRVVVAHLKAYSAKPVLNVVSRKIINFFNIKFKDLKLVFKQYLSFLRINFKK